MTSNLITNKVHFDYHKQFISFSKLARQTFFHPSLELFWHATQQISYYTSSARPTYRR